MKVELRKIRDENHARYWGARLVCELERLREEDAISDDFHIRVLVTDGNVIGTDNDMGEWWLYNEYNGWLVINLNRDYNWDCRDYNWDCHESYNSLEEKIKALAKSLMWLAARKEFRDALHATKFAPTDVYAGITAWLTKNVDAESFYLGEYLAEMCRVYRDTVNIRDITNMRNYAYDHGMII